MSTYVDQKYINILSPRLEKFGWIKTKVATCRCPICGDSKHNKIKRRFYFYESKNKFVVKCHNCGYSNTFSHFLESHDSNLYKEYRIEAFKETINYQFTPSKKVKEPDPVDSMTFSKPVFAKDPLDGCPTIADLPEDHPARVYVVSRRIPEQHLTLLRYAPNFKETASKLDEEAAKNCPTDGRLIIPFYTRTGELFCIQGRSLLKHSVIRYITIRDKDRSDAKIFGLERFDDAGPVAYCVEGPLDSLFLDNCLAMAGADVPIDSIPSRCVFIFDNECRNAEILKRMQRIADMDRPICIWPERIHQKDINDMVLSGVSDIPKIIADNTFTGLEQNWPLQNGRRFENMAESRFELTHRVYEDPNIDAPLRVGYKIPPETIGEPIVYAPNQPEELTKNITWDDVKDDPNAIKILDYGFIVLQETMGSDKAIVDAARVSYGAGTKKVSEDRGLLRYLLRHSHTTPFEMCEAKFLVKMPIFVMRQWIRHRTANVNELSGRYSELPEEFFLPQQWRGQSKTNKQGGEEPVAYFPANFSGDDPMELAEDLAFQEYRQRLEAGVSRELARTCLPVSTYTTAFWKCDIHNIMHFLRLRLDKHAQYEIRVYAEAMYKLLQPKFPMAFEAFEDYRVQAKSFSRMEMQILKALLPYSPTEKDILAVLEARKIDLSKREVSELVAKLQS